MTVVNRQDIQGNVIRGYAFPFACYLQFKLPEPPEPPAPPELPELRFKDAREFLGALAGQVTTAEAKPEGGLALNVAVSRRGLERLGVTADALDTFPREFLVGMAARARHCLGDTGDNLPINWEQPPASWEQSPSPDWEDPPPSLNQPAPKWSEHPGDPVDLLVLVYATSDTALKAKVEDVKNCAAAHGVGLPHEEFANVLGGKDGRKGSREHFGFVDGISQPFIDAGEDPASPAAAGDRPRAPVGGLPVNGVGWAPLPLGEFVLGYPDLEEAEPELPTPDILVRNGSFLVYRKLSQDVAAFEAWVAGAANAYGSLFPAPPPDVSDTIRAKVVGRDADGQSLVGSVSPDVPNNDFLYGGDPAGERCPLGSHIRRANPRDSLGLGGALVDRHRILRRGMPYGAEYRKEEPEADGPPTRGLVFIAYCASIARQYEFVQRRWINEGDGLGIGHDQDPLVGTAGPPGGFVVGGRPPVFLGDFAEYRPFVQVRFGAYFFQPSLSALRWLVDPDRTLGEAIEERPLLQAPVQPVPPLTELGEP